MRHFGLKAMATIIAYSLLSLFSTSWSATEKNKALKGDNKAKISAKLSKYWQGSTIKPYIDANGYVVVDPQAEEAVLVCKRGFICILDLHNYEVLPGGADGILLGSSFWKTSITQVSIDGIARTTIAFQPAKVDGVTNAVIITNFNVYSIRLIATSDTYMPKMRFNIQSNVLFQEVLEQSKAHSEQKLSDIATKQTKQRGRQTVNKRYIFDGDDQYVWRPLHAYDDSINTTIILSPKSKNHDAPIVVSIVDDGEEIIEYSVNGNQIIAKGVYEKIAIKIKDQIVFVINEGFYD